MSGESPTRSIPHGTAGGYSNHGCRCDECRHANTVKHLDYMQRHPEQQAKHRDRMRALRAQQTKETHHG